MLHAGPDATKIDRVHPIEFLAGDISGFERRRLDASIVESGVQPSERQDGLLDHRCDL
jgi:hypothetical protein